VATVIRAYVLIQTEVGQTGRVAREVAEIEGTGSPVPVAGPYDVIAIVEAGSIDSLGKIVVSSIQGVKGVTRTLTCPVVHI
jgi:DNA-binding Lrp family transcriptional regulator